MFLLRSLNGVPLTLAIMFNFSLSFSGVILPVLISFADGTIFYSNASSIVSNGPELP